MTKMADLLGQEVTLGVARVVGPPLALLAETISSAFRVVVEVPQLNEGKTYADVAEDYTSTVRDMLPSFLEAVDELFVDIWSISAIRCGRPMRSSRR